MPPLPKEGFADRSKFEVHVVTRIRQLRKQGLWSAKRLPKVMEAPRRKSHWDYVLEEMAWMATDFAQELRWKKAAAKMLADAVMRYHHDLNEKKRREEEEENNRMRTIAATIAREVQLFWGRIYEIASLKERVGLEDRCRKTLENHVSFVRRSLREPVRRDGQYTPEDSDLDSCDDEQTLIDAEKEDGLFQANDQSWRAEVDREIDDLKADAEKPLDEILTVLPREFIDTMTGHCGSSSSLSAPVSSQSEESDNESFFSTQEGDRRFGRESDSFGEDGDFSDLEVLVMIRMDSN